MEVILNDCYFNNISDRWCLVTVIIVSKRKAVSMTISITENIEKVINSNCIRRNYTYQVWDEQFILIVVSTELNFAEGKSERIRILNIFVENWRDYVMHFKSREGSWDSEWCKMKGPIPIIPDRKQELRIKIRLKLQRLIVQNFLSKVKR